MLLRIPRNLEQKRVGECTQLRTRFQNDLDLVDFSQPMTVMVSEEQSGSAVQDEWGCVWERNEAGLWNYSKTPRYNDILELEGIRFPKNPVTTQMTETVNHLCADSNHFILVQTRVHPFRRLCALGGVPAASSLIQKKPRELREIATRLFDYYKRQVAAWCLTDADALGFEDDLADERGIRFSVQRWNEVLVPMYKEFFAKVRACDKFVFFTGSGDFEEFIPGLIYAGVDCIRFDANAMDAKLLADRYGHRIAFQPVLKSEVIEEETPDALAEKILALRSAFCEMELIAECQMPLNAPVRQIAAAMLNWRRRMPVSEGF